MTPPRMVPCRAVDGNESIKRERERERERERGEREREKKESEREREREERERERGPLHDESNGGRVHAEELSNFEQPVGPGRTLGM